MTRILTIVGMFALSGSAAMAAPVRHHATRTVAEGDAKPAEGAKPEGKKKHHKGKKADKPAEGAAAPEAK